MFLIISFPQATRKAEDQQVSVLSSLQAGTGRASICLFVGFFGVVFEQMYLYHIWLGFSYPPPPTKKKEKKQSCFLTFISPVENAKDCFSVLLKYLRRRKQKEK